MSFHKSIRKEYKRNLAVAKARRWAYCLGWIIVSFLWVIGCSASHYAIRPSDQFWSGVRPAYKETERLARNARYLKVAGRTQLALKELEEAHQRDPDNLKIVDLLTQCYEELGEWQRAEDLYLEALDRHEDNAALANNLGFSYYLAGKYEAAESCFRKALKRHPHNEAVLNNLGLVLTKMGRQDEAYVLWQKAAGEGAARQRLSQARVALGLEQPPLDRQAHRGKSLRKTEVAAVRTPHPQADQVQPNPTSREPDTSPVGAPADQRQAGQEGSAPAQGVQMQRPGATGVVPPSAVAAAPPPGGKGDERPEQSENPRNAKSHGGAVQIEVSAVGPREDKPQNQAKAQVGMTPLKPEPKSSLAPVALPVPSGRLPILTVEELLHTKIEILNGNGVNNLARRNRSWLHLEGYDTVAIGNYKNFAREQTEIIYRPRASRVAQVLGAKFFRTNNLKVNPELEQGLEVQVVLGHDVLQKEDILAKLAE